MAKTKKVRTRKRGKTWSYIFEAGQVNGKRKVVEKGGYATEKDAYNAGVEKYTDFMHGDIGITSEAITLKDFMTNWLEEVVSLNVKPTTMQIYQSYFKNQILPHIGEVKIQELTPAILDNWIRGLQKAGLSRNTILSVYIFLQHALNYAVYPTQLISSNPAVYIKVPKNAPKNIIKRHIITPAQFRALLEKYPFGTILYIPLLLLYYTGMRLGEVLGLMWSDIDFEAKKIKLSRQIVYIKERGYSLSTLKTESSKRYILIDDFLLSELKRWQAQQAENENQLGNSYIYTYLENDGHIVRQSKGLPAPAGEKVSLICTRDNGHLILKEYVVKLLRQEGLNAHSFRHTHATLLIENGATPKEVSGRLGHSNIFITQNLYTHVTEKMSENATSIFTKIMQTNS